jgi:hypothetical protein
MAATEPVPAGRLSVTGVVPSERWVETEFGGVHRILVWDYHGWRVACSIPSWSGNQGMGAVHRGSRVRFDATITRSQSDPTFGHARAIQDGRALTPPTQKKRRRVALRISLVA